MKILDYLRQDMLNVALFAAGNPPEPGASGLDAVLAAIEEHAGGLLPETCNIGRKTAPFSRQAVGRLLASRKPASKTIIGLSRESPPAVDFSLHFVGPGWDVQFWLNVYIPLVYFTGDDAGAERASQLVVLLRYLATASHALYGYAHPKSDLSLGDNPVRVDPGAEKRVYDAYWFNLYGPELVGKIGRDRLLATPSDRIEELPYGGVLWLTRPTPADFATEVAREAQARALAHLRSDISFDQMLTVLLARSAKLAPVERDWDPDLTPVLELTLDDLAYAERETETARLNGYRPPEVSEWRPLADLLPSDLADPQAAIDQYSELHAERLAALLMKAVPAVMEGGPESLPEIDYHFWHFDYPGSFRREDIESDLVPAVGAYLGEILVHHMDGRWVPRQNIEESQVVLGDRIWLPFLRARHYLKSKEAILDFSLTQFHSVAERQQSRGGADVQ